MSPDLARAELFCRRFGLKMPVLLAPMAGACPPSLSIAMTNAGSLGACGALLMRPDEIIAWAEEVRVKGNGPYQLNLRIPDPAPLRDKAHEDRVRAFLDRFGPSVSANAGDAKPPDFAAQCEALLAIKPPIVSSVMGLYPPEFVVRLKQAGIGWFANISTVAEARAAEDAGADVVVAQGMEAGGHRGCFNAAKPSGSKSVRSRSCRLLSTPSEFRWSPPAVLPMLAALRRRSCSAPARRRSAPGCCDVLRRSCLRPGPTRCRTRRRRTRWSAGSSAAGCRAQHRYRICHARRPLPDAPPPAPYPVQRGVDCGHAR